MNTQDCREPLERAGCNSIGTLLVLLHLLKADADWGARAVWLKPAEMRAVRMRAPNAISTSGLRLLLARPRPSFGLLEAASDCVITQGAQACLGRVANWAVTFGALCRIEEPDSLRAWVAKISNG